MNAAHISLEEDEMTGPWTVAKKEVAAQLSQQLPPYTIVVEMLQQSRHTPKLSVKPGNKPSNQGQEHPLLLEAAKRVMWLYHRHFPNLVEESIPRVRAALAPFNAEGKGEGGVDVLNQLHSFRLLGELDNLALSAKTGE